ncbi:hypothetical protein [Luteibacter sp.]|uniref:hypothetical protein n=1 Tax=Luteibacter sp. TaxID=1886636 RepID=UPI003F8083A5
MLKSRRSRLWSGIALCAAVIALVVYWPPSRLPDGRAADTKEEFEKRKLWLIVFDGVDGENLAYNNARAREAAARETLEATEVRLAETTIDYDFAWRTDRPADKVAALDVRDQYPVEANDPRRSFDDPARTPRRLTLVRPGIWVVQSPDATDERGEAYVIRLAASFPRPHSFWQAKANFRLAPSLGVAATTLRCEVSQKYDSLASIGYCIVPASGPKADPVADAALLDRLTALQNAGPKPVMTGAEIESSMQYVRSGDLAVEHVHKAAEYARMTASSDARYRHELIIGYTIYAVAGLVLLGIPAIALFAAIRARRSSGARTGSGVFGVICACLAGGAVYLAGKTGAWGLMLSIILIVFALSTGLAALIGLVGATCGRERD